MNSSRHYCIGILATALAVSAIGCSSMTNARIGQITTGGHVAITELKLPFIAPADEGFGIKIGLGVIEVGATTTHDPEANHLALGIESSTGFDGVEDTLASSETKVEVLPLHVSGKVTVGSGRISLNGTAELGKIEHIALIDSSTGLEGMNDTLITSATRVGVGPVEVGGELAVGLGRITLKGGADVSETGPVAAYFDHWTGMTDGYEPFPDVTGNLAGNTLRANGYLDFGPLGLSGGLDVHRCRPLSFESADGQTTIGLGPATLQYGASCGECGQAISFGCYIGITDTD